MFDKNKKNKCFKYPATSVLKYIFFIKFFPLLMYSKKLKEKLVEITN